ncbi:metacaspase-3-like [Impatiens glandulifera]|uniref:metacaspase-3-like n=1 Tax=Impatiens glandulifera TaxID=253017 RepID=UPI001FB0B707|nr:metacaspase-3-like [Impatiens glandulifera]
MERCVYCKTFFKRPIQASFLQCPTCRAILPQSNNYNTNVTSPNHYNGGVNNGYSYYIHPHVANNYHPPVYSPYGRRRAVVIGVSYNNNEKNRVYGSVNDARSMSSFLIRSGFPIESIFVLTEEEKHPSQLPTKYNIQMAIRWLLYGSKSGDSLIFFFSGHGSRVSDTNGDEEDGYDESLCPFDYATQGKLLDDELNETLVRPLPYGAKLHAIIDACYSGTCLDLPFVSTTNKKGFLGWEDQTISATYKGTFGGKARCFSACADHESTLDTTALTGNYVTGAMTYSFIQALQQTKGLLTYGHLLQTIRLKLVEVQQRQNSSNTITTVPQLSSNQMFDVHSEYFTM